MKPHFFSSPDKLRAWLEKNHAKETELIVGFYKVGTGKPSITWSQSVDQALCFGWIDGIRRTIDEKSYQIRFTPRKASSIWSAVNIQKMEELTKQGLMTPAGLASFKNRKDERSKIYTHENEEMNFSPVFEKQLKANKAAWNYFQALAPGYRKLCKNWVMGAKQEATQLKRMMQLIEDCASGTNRWKDNKYKK